MLRVLIIAILLIIVGVVINFNSDNETFGAFNAGNSSKGGGGGNINEEEEETGVRPGPTCNTYYDENNTLVNCPEFQEFHNTSLSCGPISANGCTELQNPFRLDLNEFNCTGGMIEYRSRTRPCQEKIDCFFRWSILTNEGYCWQRNGNVFEEVRCATVPGCRGFDVQMIAVNIPFSEPVADAEICADLSNLHRNFRNVQQPCYSHFNCYTTAGITVTICTTCSSGRDCGASCDNFTRCRYLLNDSVMERIALTLPATPWSVT